LTQTETSLPSPIPSSHNCGSAKSQRIQPRLVSRKSPEISLLKVNRARHLLNYYRNQKTHGSLNQKPHYINTNGSNRNANLHEES
jgi:hypothetical protein